MRTSVRIALRGKSGGLWLSLWSFLALYATSGVHAAFAQDQPAACAFAVGRVVSIQGNVDVRRAGSGNWARVNRLDTLVCAGDELRTLPLSRAALFVQPETLVRVDQNTTITLSQTTLEIVVEFFQDEIARAARDAQSCGAGYFITRFPKSFRVNTPHLNAAVEGTEFQVRLSCDSTQLTVIEGEVRSQTVATREERVLSSGQSLVASQSSPGVLSTVVRPTDAVQWVLYYPPLSDAKGEADIPTPEQCRGMASPADRSCLTERAEALLALGRSDEALRNVDEVLALDASNGDANALRAITQIGRNDKAAALQSANAATASAPNSYRAWLALSYAQQAAFDLEQALESAKKAQALEPNSSLLNARVAELLLSVGRTSEAEAAARAAVQSNPAESRAHTMLGFVHLAQIDTKTARADFETAINSNSFESLPRLGLGLVMIRGGQLVEGREQLEIAVALDPSSSLIRSYVGKAYYEEDSKERDALAADQFDLAKQLDPADPTPWFYGALLKDSQTRPVEALGELDKSTALNDDRAVYRSRQQLDQDLAARNASQATVYNELGFRELGLTKAAQSLAVDPADGSAHRFLADIYATLPRHEIARASELLQSQLRQPLGAPPLQAQLANDIAFKNTFFGPATVGVNEFNPLFISDGNDLQFFGLLGDDDTQGDQAIVSGLHGPMSFSLSQFAANTDGYRPNNDDRQRQYDGFVQAQFGTGTSAQAELTHAERQSGDLTSTFDSANFSETLRSDEEIDTQRAGLRQALGAHSDMLLSIIREDRHFSVDTNDPFFPITIVTDDESWKAEAQYLTTSSGFDVMLGAGYFEGDSDIQLIFPDFTDRTLVSPRHTNAYGYLSLPTRGRWPQVQVGVSYDDLTSEVGDQSELNPKLGVVWKASDSVTLRAAGYRMLKRQINSDQGLEPTQLAGFNQFFDDDNGTVVEGGGLAADFVLRPALTAGLQFTRRNLDAPFFDDEITIVEKTEKAASGYLYWLPTDRVSVALEPEYQDFEVGAAFGTMQLTEVPLTLRYFSPSGLWMGVSVTGVKQEGEFTDAFGDDVAGSDEFWLVDAIVAYRLPRRLGTISLQASNLSNEQFQFQEIDLRVAPRYIPERRWLLRISLSL